MIVPLGVCVDGKVVKDGFWRNPATGQKFFGVTSPTPCEKCDGKGCPKPEARQADQPEQ
jgi:hypothetical protein